MCLFLALRKMDPQTLTPQHHWAVYKGKKVDFWSYWKRNGSWEMIRSEAATAYESKYMRGGDYLERQRMRFEIIVDGRDAFGDYVSLDEMFPDKAKKRRERKEKRKWKWPLAK